MKRRRSGGSLLNLRVDQLLRCWPEAAQAFIAFHLACIGCAFARFHTLRQALEIYEIDPDAFLEKLMESRPIPDCVGNPDSKEH